MKCYRPVMDVLEDRLVPDAALSILGGVVTYTGDTGANDFSFTRLADEYVISNNNHTIVTGVPGVTYSNGNRTATFSAIGISQLNFSFDSGSANDVFLGGFDAPIAALNINGGSNPNSDVTLTGTGLTSTGTVTLIGFDDMTIGQSLTAAGNITLGADAMIISQPISAGANRVTVHTRTNDHDINLGAADNATRLGLNATELDFITAGVLQIGNANAGVITVSAALTPANVSTVTLITGAAIVDSGSLTVTNLRFSATGNVALDGGFSTVAGSTSGSVSITNNANLTVGNVDTASGISSGGNIDVVVSGSLLVAANVTTTSNNDITLTTVDAAAVGQNIQVNGTVTIQSGTGDLILRAGDNLTIATGASLTTSGTGEINLTVDFGSADPQGNTLTAIGVIYNTATITDYAGGSQGDTFVTTASANTVIRVAGTGGVDTIQVDGEGQVVTASNGLIRVNTRQNITLTSVENVFVINAIFLIEGDDGDNTAVYDPVAGTLQVDTTNYIINSNSFIYDGLGGSDSLTVQGTNVDDSLLFRTRSGSPDTSEFSLNGGPFHGLINVESFDFNGLAGNDLMTVDYVFGNPVRSGGIDYDGGGNNDILAVTSPLADARTGSYLPGANFGDGTISVSGGNIRFANLAPVDITGFATFTVLMPDSHDVIDIAAGTAFTNPLQNALVISGSSFATPFEPLAVWNVTNLIIDTTTVAGTDTITLAATGAAAAHNVANLQIITGTLVDTVNVTGTVNLAGSLTIDVGTGDNTVTFQGITINAPTGIAQLGDGNNVLNGITTTLNTTIGNISLAAPVQGTAANAQTLLANSNSGNIALNSVGNTVSLNTLTLTTVTGTNILSGIDDPPEKAYRAGTQIFNGETTVSAGTVTFDGTPHNGPITFNGTLTGTSSAVIVTTSGNTNFIQAVSVGSLVTNGGGNTRINTATVTTVNGQTYDDAVVLLVTTTLTSTNNQTIQFNNTVNGLFGLTVTTSGDTIFNQPVSVGSLLTNGGGNTRINTATVTTANAQTYDDAVLLLVTSTLTSTNNQTIRFNNTIDGPGGLTVDTTGDTIFGDFILVDSIGNGTALAFLTTNPGGTTAINGGLVRTTGNQSYQDPVTVGSVASFITTTGGTIRFFSTLSSPPCTNVTFDDLGSGGDIVFDDIVSGLGTLTINNAENVTINASMTVSALVQLTGTGTTQFNGDTTVTASCPFAGVYELDVSNANVVLNANVTADSLDARFIPLGVGVNQTAGNLLVGNLRLEGTGAFNLLQPGNDVAFFLSANINGPLNLADANDLVIRPATDSIPAGLFTSDDAVLLRAGRNFTADNIAVTLIDVGAGAFQAIPGLASPSLTVFNTNIRASSAILGSSTFNSDNILDDIFRIRPSTFVAIQVEGNQPETLPLTTPGDKIQPLFGDHPEIPVSVTTTPIIGTNSFDGTYKFGDGSIFRDVNFFSMEGLDQLKIQAVVFQTTYNQFSITLNVTQPFAKLVNNVEFLAPENLFVVSPRIVNPRAPFGAPRVTVGDIDGNNQPDLIIANGSNASPVVTVVKGEKLFGIISDPDPTKVTRLTKNDILAQFFAFDPRSRYAGGLFVAAGDVQGDGLDGKDEIIIGSDIGPRATVKVFSFDTFSKKMNLPGTDISTLLPASFGTKGARVAVGKVTGSENADIVVGSGPGVTNRVAIITGGDTFALRRTFSPYTPSFRGGIQVAVGKYDNDVYDDILTGPGIGRSILSTSGPRVFVFSGALIKDSAPETPPAPGVNNPMYLFNQTVFFTPESSGLRPRTWHLTQGVSSVAFSRLPSEENTIVVGSPRGLRTQLLRYTNSNTAPTNYFEFFNDTDPGLNSTEQVLSDRLFTRYRDGASIVSALLT
ncbi:MAG: hypothetical protein JNJ77_21140 [Planctomycetia bacterium]|nr:hypothetical protein [Planctomycetia bacterium]